MGRERGGGREGVTLIRTINHSDLLFYIFKVALLNTFVKYALYLLQKLLFI